MKADFPDIYPKDLLSRIIEDGAGENTIELVYRIANYGKNDRDAFLSTLLTDIKDMQYNNRDAYLASKEIPVDIGIYSTSLSESEKDVRKLIRIMEQKYEGPVLLKGTVLPEFGLSMFTRNSKSKRRGRKHHIDWWIYKDMDPSPFFEKIVVEEE